MDKKIAIFSTQPYDKESFELENKNYNFDLEFFTHSLCKRTAMTIEDGSVVCAFVNDDLSRDTLVKLKDKGVSFVAMRCAGFNNVDIAAAKELGIDVARVPSYSPNAVAEHAIALMLSLNRKINKAYNRTREGNFNINGLMGFDIYGKTVGLIGVGQIGAITARILKGFGANVIVYDPHAKFDTEQIASVSLAELLAKSDIISLHCPLNAETQHIISDDTINQMKPGVMLINTSRGAVLDTKATIQGLKNKRIGYLGIDVYEEEEHIFHQDLSAKILQDDDLARLLSFPNVIVTGHQAFFTQEAVTNIAKTTFSNVAAFFNKEQDSLKTQLAPNLVTV